MNLSAPRTFHEAEMPDHTFQYPKVVPVPKPAPVPVQGKGR